MNNLPTELLHNTFILLPHIQKKECMLVCRRWADTIQRRSLLHTVHIDNINTFRKFLSLLKERLELTLQVENLTLFSCMDGVSDKSFLLLFPNAKVIELSPCNDSFLKSTETYEPSGQELCWDAASFNRLYHIRDFYECGLTRLLLAHGLCSHLITLNLNIKTTDKLPPNIFPLLKDMPVLKSLVIDHSPLTIDTMEMLHTNIPSLQSLKLSGVNLLRGTIPINITPVTAFTTLRIWTYDDDFETRDVWLQYICKKYTHLQHFNFQWEESSYCRELKNVYGSGYTRLLQTIGPQLKSLALDAFLDRNYAVLRNLDDFGCHFTELKLNLADDENAFDALAKTKQFKLIEKLSLFKVETGQNLDQLKEMDKLKSLSITYVEYNPLFVFDEDEEEEIENFIEGVTIDLNKLFRSFPKHVKSVCIVNPYVHFGDTQSEQQQQQQQQYPNIEKLEFSSINSQKNMDLFISGHFPNLHSLTLIDCFKPDSILVLPNHHFSYLELSLPLDSRLSVSLITADRHEPRFYTTNKRQKKIYSEMDGLLLPISKDDMIGIRKVIVHCGSVKKLVLDYEEAYLISDKYEFQSLK